MIERMILYKQCLPLHVNNSGSYKTVYEMIVSSVCYTSDGTPIDWAAYKGYVLGSIEVEEAKNIIGDWGDKISEAEARALAPQLKDIRYRY